MRKPETIDRRIFPREFSCRTALSLRLAVDRRHAVASMRPEHKGSGKLQSTIACRYRSSSLQ